MSTTPSTAPPTTCPVCSYPLADGPSKRTLVGRVHETCPTDRYAEAIVEWVRARRGLQTAARERPAASKRGDTGRARDRLRDAELRLEELADEITRR